ncbi:purple acid phosphatases superfamily protein [Artemisia annua]|uniref:Purple acid phosphatase n=1 Tax=Artemisia annua TaxID=35608 RepID=A0A2U1PQ83_ARTAN|nr:purple acid phosphatases superfamily protein [Artemisia annua]
MINKKYKGKEKINGSNVNSTTMNDGGRVGNKKIQQIDSHDSRLQSQTSSSSLIDISKRPTRSVARRPLNEITQLSSTTSNTTPDLTNDLAIRPRGRPSKKGTTSSLGSANIQTSNGEPNVNSLPSSLVGVTTSNVVQTKNVGGIPRLKTPPKSSSSGLATLTPRPKARQRICNISTPPNSVKFQTPPACHVKTSLTTPSPHHMNLRSRTPNSTVVDGSTPRNSSIPSRKTGNMTANGKNSLTTPSPHHMNLRSRTPKSTVVDASTPRNSVVPNTRAGTMSNQKSRFVTPSPVNFTLGSSSSKRNQRFHGESSTFATDMRGSKGKNGNRKSSRRINFAEFDIEDDDEVQANRFLGICDDYIDHGDPNVECDKCGAMLWYHETVHISLVGKDRMRISWITINPALPTVYFGTSSGKYEDSATGATTFYQYKNYTSGSIHEVVIGPLSYNTVYYYSFGNSSSEYSLKTPPAKFPIKFAVSGDLGQTHWTISNLQHISQSNYDVFILPGDLSYADTIQPLWDSFGRLVEPLASRRAWMVIPGDRDVEKIPDTVPFTAYNARWHMPYENSSSSSNLYYSFEVSKVHVIMLSSYTDFGPVSDQYHWLELDLARVNRTKTPWLIAVMHAPWYSTNYAHKGEKESDGMRESMEGLLYKARVDMVFASHVDAYERFNRVYNHTETNCAPVHITIGAGGNLEGLADKFMEPQPNISAFREASFGHGEFLVGSESYAIWSWHRNNEEEHVQSDSLWINSLASDPLCN